MAPGSSVIRKYVGVGSRLAVGRGALARGHGGDARRAEVRPHDLRAGEPRMRRDQQAVDLLIGIVVEREGDPVRTRARGTRLEAAPHDAVGARRRRYLDGIAAGRMEILHDLGHVDRAVSGLTLIASTAPAGPAHKQAIARRARQPETGGRGVRAGRTNPLNSLKPFIRFGSAWRGSAPRGSLTVADVYRRFCGSIVASGVRWGRSTGWHKARGPASAR